jgi:ATP-binding cassette subfamily B protein
MRRVMIGASRRIEYELRQDLFEHLQSLSSGAFGKMRIGDIMSRANSDLEGVRMVIGPAVMYLVNTMFVFPLALAMMFLMNAKLALLSVVPLVLLSISIRTVITKMYRTSKEVQERMARISTHAQENFSGVRVVKAFHREPAEIEAFADLNRDYLDANIRLARTRGTVNALIESLSGAGILLVLWIGGIDILRGNFTLGEFVAFNAYHMMLIWPMIAMGWVLSLFQRGIASMERVNEILHREPDIADGPEAAPLERIRGEIEFRDLSFAHDGESPVLRGIRLHVPAGSTVAIVGRTGSGKSTLVNLIARLLPVPRNRLFLDGREIHTIPLHTLRRSIGFVPQDAFLFSDTVRNNIAFGEPEADDRRVEKAAEAAGMRETIEELPDRYGQMLGERGVNLSGGQKQRLTIARALLPDGPILILDDCLSAVDTETEERILRQLRPRTEGKTCIVISHRVSTVRDADRIYVLDEGEIVEEGTHDELVARGGIYREMDRLQKLERELEQI